MHAEEQGNKDTAKRIIREWRAVKLRDVF